MEFPKLKNKYVLAPMAGVTNIAFRMLCREYGASLAWTEQINAFALSKDNLKNINKTVTAKEDRPLVLQLSGNDPWVMLKAAKKEKDYDVLDINMGCPSQKIVKQGFGSALLKEKNKIRILVKTLVKGIKVPVTAKIRSGFRKDSSIEISKLLEKAGISAITIHARTKDQRYSGKADWSIIKNVKDAVKVPVIGNGDVTNPERAKEMLEITGCDYIMIGRAAIKNPYVFRQCIDFEKTGRYDKPNKLEMLKRYLELCKKYECETNLKMIASSFLKGEENSAKIRDSIARAKTDDEVISIFNNFLKKQ